MSLKLEEFEPARYGNIDEPISKLRTRQVVDPGPTGVGTRPSIFTPLSGVEGHVPVTLIAPWATLDAITDF